MHYIGPCVWTKSVGAASADWLNELQTDRPWVHATEGTAQYQEPFLLRATAKGLADQPVEVILTTGQSRDPATLGLGPLPPNVRVERWLSHEEFLPRCAAIITTGGAATVLASLKAGVPLVVAPTFWDKNDNAQRVVEAGVGLRLAPKHCTPERVRAAVTRVLTETHFRENAQRMAQRMKQTPGPPRAAELLEALARQTHLKTGAELNALLTAS